MTTISTDAEGAPVLEQLGRSETSASPREPAVRVTGLVKQFRRASGETVYAVDDVTLDVAPGEFTVLLGPSGCGKTTLLRCIAGLEKPIGGRIEVAGRVVYDSATRVDVAPERRGINMIFQSYALWPHMTALSNVAYPLRSRKVAKAEALERARGALALVGIPELTAQYPSQMSGGQQQRVALARAVVSNSELVLFDEPLSNVDAKVREQLRIELIAMQRDIGFAAVYVTHDQTEAMELAHNVAVLDAGKVVQLGPPREIYEQPRSRYVAGFIGTTNELSGTVVGRPGTGRVEVETGLGVVVASSGEEHGVGAEVVVVSRPERTVISTTRPTSDNAWQGVVKASFFSGAHTEHIVDLDDGRAFRIWRTDREVISDGAPVWVGVSADDFRTLSAEEPAPEADPDPTADTASGRRRWRRQR